LGFNLLALLGVVVALYLGQTIFIPITIALLLAAVLAPAANWLHRRLRFPWSIACLATIVGVVLLNLLITGVFAVAIPRVLSVLPRAPERSAADAGEKKDQQQVVYETLVAKLKAFSPVEVNEDYFPRRAEDSPVFLWLRETVQKYTPEALLKVGYYALTWLWQWVLILFILLFLLLEGRMLSRRVVEIFGPSPQVRDQVGLALADMARQVRTYLVGRTLINFGLAVIVGVVFQAVGLHQAWTWAILLAILNYIPYLGPIIAGIPPVLDALLSMSPWGAVGILVFYTVIVMVEGYLVVPVLMGRSMEMNATTAMLACLFWDLVWGTPGLFLAMPLMAAIKTICYHVPGWRPWANLMGTTEADEAGPLDANGSLLGDYSLQGPVTTDTEIHLPVPPAPPKR
jgi:predicted PurR-regulated permease PerM